MHSSNNIFSVAFQAMAGTCEVRLPASDEDAARKLAQAAVDEVRRIEYKFSRYRDDSIVSRINAAAGRDWVACDDETAALLTYADALFETSDGLFDITCGVLRRVWDFRQAALPNVQDLQAALALVGWDRVERDASNIRLPLAGMELDFGGFGKEYAADRAAAILMAQGLEYGYVNLGGDMRFMGPQPDGSPWSIGIQDPRRPDAVVATIPIYSGALTTSGDYERFFELDGQRYCHILDPGTGYPVRHWRSVSVLAPLAIAAGSCATVAMLKQADALDFLDGAHLAYLAIDGDGKLHRKDLA